MIRDLTEMFIMIILIVVFLASPIIIEKVYTSFKTQTKESSDDFNR